MFNEAIAEGNMECYFPLSEQFMTQKGPPTCGSTTLSMVLNALSLDPQQSWKGVWRWWCEDNIKGVTPKMLERGMHLQQFTSIALQNFASIQTFYHPMDALPRGFKPKGIRRPKASAATDGGCNGCAPQKKVQSTGCCAPQSGATRGTCCGTVASVMRVQWKCCVRKEKGRFSEEEYASGKTTCCPSETSVGTDSERGEEPGEDGAVPVRFYKEASLATFRLCVLASSRRQGLYVIVNMNRKTLSQTGDGHFMPLGGYNQARDHVLCLDVARFKYPPYWCAVELLYRSLADRDADSRRTRGFGLVSKRDSQCGVACKVRHDYVSSAKFASQLPQLRSDLQHAAARGEAQLRTSARCSSTTCSNS